jgi:hypothetical protein
MVSSTLAGVLLVDLPRAGPAASGPPGAASATPAGPSSAGPAAPGPAPRQPYVCAYPYRTVVFNETGLWNGTTWNVNLSGTVSSSNGTFNEFCETSTGSLPFCVTLTHCAPPTGIGLCAIFITGEYSISPQCSYVKVSGSLTYLNVTFRPVVAPCTVGGSILNPTPADYYEVNFTETGLPAGNTWGIASAGLAAPEAGWNTTTSDSLCLRFPNGTFSYSANSQQHHYGAGSGTFTVDGPATRPARIVCGEPVGTVVVLTAVAIVRLTFTPTTYDVQFDESGLPNGTVWWVNLTGGQINGTMALESNSGTATASLVNNYAYNFTAAPANKDYNWSRTPNSVTVFGANQVLSVRFNAVTFAVVFDESKLPVGTTWYINISGQRSLSNTTSAQGGTTISTALINGSYSYTPGASGTWKAPAGTFQVQGPTSPITVTVTFVYVGRLPFTPPVESQFLGPFVGDGVTNFADTIGVYTAHPGYADVVSVSGTLDGSAVSFVDVGGGLWTTSVDVGGLSPGAVLNVLATYPNGSYATASYPFQVATPPSWLVSFLHWSGGGQLASSPSQPWNNSYELGMLGDFALGSQFSVSLPFPEFAGGGSYGFVPSIDLSLAIETGGVINLSAAFSISTPDIDAGPASVSVSASISATGSFAISNGTIAWESASLTFSLSGSVSVNIPIAGYTFSVPGYGDVTIGLSATITVEPMVAVTLFLLPSSSSGLDLLPGLSVMLQSITATIGAEVDVALNAGVGGLSISGEGGVDVTLYIEASPPYIEGGKITGTVSINYQVLWWSGTLWSDSGTLYSWGSSSPGAHADPDVPRVPPDQPSNNSSVPTVIPRYWTTGPYDQQVWAPGKHQGVAYTDVYPFTHLAAADGSSQALVLSTTDEPSLPEDQGLSVQGFLFNGSTGVLTPMTFNLPVLASEVAFDPVAEELPNGSYAVAWNSLPFANSSAASPFALNSSVVQLAYFDPVSATWTGLTTLVGTPGFVQSFALHTVGSSVFVLEQVGPSVLSNASVLEEIAGSGKLLSSLPVPNVSKIVAFRPGIGLAIVQVDNGSSLLLNLTTGLPVDATAGLGCPIVEMTFVQDSANGVATLLAGIPNDTLVLTLAGRSPVVVPLPRNASGLSATDYDGRTLVTVSGPFGVRTYLIVGSTVDPIASVRWHDVSQLVTAIAGSHLIVVGLQGYGNYTEESGRGSYSYENLSVENVGLGEANVTFDEKGLPSGTSWSVATGTPANATSTTGKSLVLAEPFGPFPYLVNDSAGYAVAVTTPAADAGIVNLSGPLTITLDFARVGSVSFLVTGLPNGTMWSVELTSKATGGPPAQIGTSTNGTLGFSLVDGKWRWTVASSNFAYAPAPSHGALSLGKEPATIRIRFHEVTSRVTFVEKGLPRGSSWTLSISGGPSVNVTGTSIALRLPNGTYNYTISTSRTGYAGVGTSGLFAVVAPQPFRVEAYFSGTGG